MHIHATHDCASMTPVLQQTQLSWMHIQPFSHERSTEMALAERIDKYLTTQEVARRYRVAPATVRRWRNSGYIPGAVKRGQGWLYDPDKLDRWDGEQDGAAA
ncbi:helix-turn-helix domain-containing protein [Streptomyces sp. NBC_01264]|uniref:helix-turn-helix domain-containing protein n=1 Tax=Streptomyces sp. NBC_01264 TaxID=2903804 RepID=UPI00224D666B|nr:helix-turn-helix domain-containing protein [Streptomyces sp. NBC_01264]MCX4780915.1 helix-turn-helix domain-containing protein [Streptomyces sp. NBC_01264]